MNAPYCHASNWLKFYSYLSKYPNHDSSDSQVKNNYLNCYFEEKKHDSSQLVNILNCPKKVYILSSGTKNYCCH